MHGFLLPQQLAFLMPAFFAEIERCLSFWTYVEHWPALYYKKVISVYWRCSLAKEHCTKKWIYKSSKIVANVEKIPHLIKFGHICSKPKFMFERDLRKRQIPHLPNIYTLLQMWEKCTYLRHLYFYSKCEGKTQLCSDLHGKQIWGKTPYLLEFAHICTEIKYRVCKTFTS